MSHREIAVRQPPVDEAVARGLMDRVRAAHAARIHPEIADPTDARRAVVPHLVECFGLTVHDPGEAFAEEFQRRRPWCREHCGHAFAVEPVRDRAEGRDTGRRFRFADLEEAAMFRLTWG